MKLYATVTSERASKGQGGNEFLDIVVTDSNKKERFSVSLVVVEDTVIIQTHGAGVMRRTFELPTKKGEKQKGEIYTNTRGKQETVKDFLLGLD